MKTQLEMILEDTLEKCGVKVFGFCSADALPQNKEEIEKILPGACSIVVIAVPHSRSAISSKNVQVRQYDTIHTYDITALASHSVVSALESLGHRAVAVPAFIPIEMTPPKRGMKGAIDWRAAGVAAGIGTYGKSGLLVTREYGSAIRIVGVVTDARLQAGKPLIESVCIGCMKCIKACPTSALLGDGKIDKKKCGDAIFATGFRAWRDFLDKITEASVEEKQKLLDGQMCMDLWQNFMTGNYYSCFVCQAVCDKKI